MRARLPWEPPARAQNRGGFMYNPPRNCRKRDRIVVDGGEFRWIDVNICGACPQQCERYLAYRKTWRRAKKGVTAEEVRQKLRRNKG